MLVGLPPAVGVLARIPGHKGVQAPLAPGFKPPLGSRPWRLRFRPQSGLVQRELYSIAAAGSCIPESKRGAPALGGQGLSPALSRGPRVV